MYRLCAIGLHTLCDHCCVGPLHSRRYVVVSLESLRNTKARRARLCAAYLSDICCFFVCSIYDVPRVVACVHSPGTTRRWVHSPGTVLRGAESVNTCRCLQHSCSVVSGDWQVAISTILRTPPPTIASSSTCTTIAPFPEIEYKFNRH